MSCVSYIFNYSKNYQIKLLSFVQFTDEGEECQEYNEVQLMTKSQLYLYCSSSFPLLAEYDIFQFDCRFSQRTIQLTRQGRE